MQWKKASGEDKDIERIIKNEISFPIKIKYDKQNNYYVSIYPALDVASQGDTPKKDEENIKEALELFALTYLEKNLNTKIPQD